MKVQNMSEPISSTAAGIFGWKALAGLAGTGGIAAAIAAYVVMMKTKPKDEEFGPTIACSVVGSLGGGAATIKYFGFEHWANDVIGLIGMGGIIFACGLPAWLLVRAMFKWMEKRKDADIAEILTDGAQAVRNVKDAL